MKYIDIKILLFLFLVSTMWLSFANIPFTFEIEGGSCYQGITASIIRLLLKVCFTLSIVSIIASFINWKTLSRILSILSFVFWSIWSVAISYSHSITEAIYFLPFLLAISTTMFVILKNRINYIKR